MVGVRASRQHGYRPSMARDSARVVVASMADRASVITGHIAYTLLVRVDLALASRSACGPHNSGCNISGLARLNGSI